MKSDDRKTWWERLVDWALQQGVSTVLLFVSVGLFIYTIQYVVPQHLLMIQSGYEALATINAQALANQELKHSEQIRLITESHTDQIKYLTDSFRQALDRNRS